ncbi:diguanylate cyclase domain-containing protein [Dactylosporangium sp. AC04546]|uniref:diguanylate cyclase domain-containing protein n=1 Tax=Dactylosporangium sp. AC04546 TaxID=2862460 RepID=UPI003FA49A5E
MLAVVTVMISCMRMLVLRVQEQHRSQRALLDAVLQRLPFPVVVTDPAGAVMMANPAAGDLLGWSPGSGTRLGDLRFTARDGRPVDLAAVSRTAVSGAAVSGAAVSGAAVSGAAGAGAEASALEVKLLRPDGTSSDILIETVPMGAEADGAGTVFALLDVSAQRLYEESLHHAAYHDALTGLPNRAMLWQHLNASVEPYAVVLVDLDDFKAINDTHGHRIGDELLAAVGQRLRAAAHGRAVVARLGGDEFAVLCPGADRAATERSASALRAAFDRPFDLSGKRVVVRGSVGYGHSMDATEPDEVMAAADAEMYRAKPDRVGQTGLEPATGVL